MIGALPAAVILAMVALVLQTHLIVRNERATAPLPPVPHAAPAGSVSDGASRPPPASAPEVSSETKPLTGSTASESTQAVDKSAKGSGPSAKGASATRGKSAKGASAAKLKSSHGASGSDNTKLTKRDLHRAAAAVPKRGPHKYRRAKVAVEAPSKRGRLITYDVSVERNLRLDPDVVARQIATVLNDRRSWRGTKKWRFKLVDSPAKASLHAYVVTPGTTDRLCAPLLTRGNVSCQNGDRVVLNAMRWMGGADAYGVDRFDYRRYLVNHEFGHALGFQHVKCRKPGRPAPVMMQQTKGLHGCRPNPWPGKSS